MTPRAVEACSRLETLRALKRVGVRLALDDFGSGWSSLWRLGHLPLTTLKIDRTLVDEMGRSGESMAVVRSVIALAHALNMDVTGEGFESAAQVNHLRDAACDHGQGFYFSEPLPGPCDDRVAGGRPAVVLVRLTPPPAPPQLHWRGEPATFWMQGCARRMSDSFAMRCGAFPGLQ